MSAKRKTLPEKKLEPPREIDGSIFYGVTLDDEQAHFANEIWRRDKDIIFVNAKAGTGKTFVATGVANMLVKYGFYDKIFYVISPYGEAKQGYLPGNIDEKSAVYFAPFFQALVSCNVNPYNVLTNDVANQKNGEAYVTCITDTFLRGQNLDDAVVIIDEAQNFTTSQLRKTLTRIGSNTKVIVIGHTLQCDLANKESSGFASYIEHFKDKERASVCTLVKNHRGWISQWADEITE